MKILHIISSLKIGGAERALCSLLEKISPYGFEHHVAFFHDGPCRETIEQMGIPFYQIRGIFHRYDPGAYYQLQKLINHIKPDLIHASLWAANIMGRLLGKHNNIPVICDLHGNSKDEGRTRNMLDRLTAHMPAHTVAVADSVKDAYIEHIITPIQNTALKNAASQALIVIKNGIDAEGLRKKAAGNPLCRADLGIPNNAFVIGSIGRFEPIKSYDVLLRAFFLLKTRFPNDATKPLYLCLVGDGS